jgi:hypothetical protein
MVFDHVGIPTNDKKYNENLVEETRVWVTNPKDHPFSIEWLRFEPDSPVTGPLREQPHVSFRVENLDEAAKGLKVLLEPFEPGGFVRVGFYQNDDGAVVELMEYLGEESDWFPDS